MNILLQILSALFILIFLFLLVLYITTISVYQEINVYNKNIDPYIYLNNLKTILIENKLDDYKSNYKNFITIVPKSISYKECVKLLTFKYDDNYTPEPKLEKLINDLIIFYRKETNSNVKLLIEFFEELLKNTKISNVKSYLEQIKAA